MCVLFVLRKAPIMRTTMSRLVLVDASTKATREVAINTKATHEVAINSAYGRGQFERSAAQGRSLSKFETHFADCLNTSYRGVEQ